MLCYFKGSWFCRKPEIKSSKLLSVLIPLVQMIAKSEDLSISFSISGAKNRTSIPMQMNVCMRDPSEVSTICWCSRDLDLLERIAQ